MQILSLASLAGPGLDRLRAVGDVVIDAWSDHVPVKLHAVEELIERCRGIDGLIVEADHIPAAFFEATSLRFLGVCRGDPNNVDLTAAAAAGVPVIKTPGRNAEAVADLAVGLTFCLLRGIVAADKDVRAGRWVVDGRLAQQRYVGREVSSCTVGLVGCGAVGRAYARRMRVLGARVLAYDPFADVTTLAADGIDAVADLGDLAARADVFSIHAPLSPATRGLVDAAIMERVRPGSFLVNTARYGIVDEVALLDALGDGRLAGAALDHFEHEFLAADHPLVAMEQVILTPHIGGTTLGTVTTQTEQIADAVTALLAGDVHPFIVGTPQ